MKPTTLQATAVPPAKPRMSAAAPDAKLEARVLWLPVADPQQRVDEVPVVVRRVADDVVEVSRTGRTIGYIQRVPPLFVALEGSRLDRAEECAQSQLWNKAAARLLEKDASHRRSAASGQDSRCALMAS